LVKIIRFLTKLLKNRVNYWLSKQVFYQLKLTAGFLALEVKVANFVFLDVLNKPDLLPLDVSILKLKGD
jgi:hypothetical protein